MINIPSMINKIALASAPVAIMGASIVLATTAKADPPGAMEHDAQMMCDIIATNPSEVTVVSMIKNAINSIGPDKAANTLAYALKYDCPQYQIIVDGAVADMRRAQQNRSINE